MDVRHCETTPTLPCLIEFFLLKSSLAPLGLSSLYLSMCFQGERLRIPPNKCCPECFPQSTASCQHEGAVYGHDSQWNSSKCSVCVCSQGKVSCTPPSCPALSCGPDESPFVPTGECCPKCARHGASCPWEGQEYRDGEEWRPGPCSRCQCLAGRVQCSTAACQPITCKPSDENLVIQPGRCCPQCVPNPCLASGKEYKHGEQWQKNSCTTCVCHQGHSQCHTQTCPRLTCAKVRAPSTTTQNAMFCVGPSYLGGGQNVEKR
ncbi:hypothetical protein ACEWY4_012155 [Coilia grayii]|uniref:VWFC domain-containing protein n=1 Tax=Coilia grayii TaxID=363190 RepID=A0ABD1JZN8_9TELE